MSTINNESNKNQDNSITNFVTIGSTCNTNIDDNDHKIKQIEQIKQTIKNILKKTLDKRILNLQTKTKE